MSAPRITRVIARFGLALAVGACADAPMEATYTEEYDVANLSHLTPEVIAQLAIGGRFPNQQVEVGYVNARTRAAAESLAKQLIAESSVGMRSYWEDERGTALDVARLRRCGPIRYSSSAYEVSLMTVDQPNRSAVVGQYLMLFCGRDGRPALRVAIPVEPSLPVSGYENGNGNILINGVPIAGEAHAVFGPAEAVRITFDRTGRRAAALPELVNQRFVSAWPRWLVRLESPMRVQGLISAQEDTIDFVMVGVYGNEVDLFLTALALRPVDLATLAAGLDTISFLSPSSLDHFTPRRGMPRWSEPFNRLDP